MITREGQREKYENDDRYHALADDFKNMYSLRNPYGLYFETRRLRALFDLLNRHRVSIGGRRVLDVGCHHGLYSNIFAYLRKSAEGVTGTDYIEEYLAVARKVNGSLAFRREDLYDFSVEPSSVDLLFLNYVLSCVPSADVPAIAARLSACVAPGGWLLFFDFHYSPAWRLLATLTGRDRDPLPSYDDRRLRAAFPDFELVDSETLLPYQSRRLVSAGLPPFALDLIEKVWMRQYYVALLRKR